MNLTTIPQQTWTVINMILMAINAMSIITAVGIKRSAHEEYQRITRGTNAMTQYESSRQQLIELRREREQRELDRR